MKTMVNESKEKLIPELKESEKISFGLGENFGIRIKGHPDFQDDYEYCSIKLLGNNRLEFEKEVEALEWTSQKLVSWKLADLLDKRGSDEEIKILASQFVVLGYENMHIHHLWDFLGIKRTYNDEGVVLTDENGKEIKDPASHVDEFLKNSKKPYNEYLRMINFASVTSHLNDPETIFKSNDSETLKKFLDYSLRVMVKSGHNRSDELLKRLAQDSELLNLIDPLLKEYAIPMLIERDFSERDFPTEERKREAEKETNELKRKLGIARP